VTSAILALFGHGGLTVIGLNTLVLSVASTGAWLAYRLWSGRMRPAWALATGTVAGQLVAGGVWFAIVWLAAGRPPWSLSPARHGAVLMLALPLWLLGAVFEGLVAWGMGRFLARVHPGLLPAAQRDTNAHEVPA
jgi:ABC-type Co2+ transport system permease subunit